MNQLERLTERELQVATLIANGLSDREIAEHLLVAKRTAEWHVEQILSKAGLKSRSQIAALVAQAEALGIRVIDSRHARVQMPARAAAFLGYKAEFSQRSEILETTRLLGVAPADETDARRQERLGAVAEAGYNPVVVGLVYATALRSVAVQYPNTEFAIVDDPSVPSAHSNVTGLVFADHEGSFLIGAIAAAASKSGVVGFIGATDTPFVARFQAGYTAGTATCRRKTRVLVEHLAQPGDFRGFTSSRKAKVVASAMYKAGADVVYHAAGGSGIGLFQAAREAGRLAIGVDSDQYLTAPADSRACILTSMLKRVEAGVRRYIQAMAAKSAFPHVARFNLANDGIGYARSNALIQPYISIADDLREQIVTRKIKVPERP